MKKYRFRTREEFELIGRWIDDDGCPECWANDGDMNHYLGQEILASHCIALCESNDNFNMDGWVFSNHDYVVMEEEDNIALAKKMYPIGTKFYPAHIIVQHGRYCIVTNDKFSNLNNDIIALTDEGHPYNSSLKYGGNDYNRLVYHEGKWAEIVKEEGSSRFKIGDWIIWDGSYKGQAIKIASIEDGGHIDTSGNWRDTKSSHYRLAHSHEIPKEEIDMKLIQEECKRRFPIGCTFKGVNNTYESVLRDGCATYSIHKDSQIYAHSGAGCLYDDGVYAELVSLPLTQTDYPLYATVGDPLPTSTTKPLIENVQSINITLRTKKQINKLKF